MRGAELPPLALAGDRIVYVSLVNGVTPPLAHLDRDCSRHLSKPPRRVGTLWIEAESAGCRLCQSCAKTEGLAE